MKSTLKIAVIALSLFLATGCAELQGNTSTSLQASGIIEATELTIAPELSGRVTEVAVSEGDSVKSGDVLFRMDDSLLQAQRREASAALTSAQKGVQTAQSGLDTARLQYDTTLSAALAAAQPDRLDAWSQSKPSEFDQPTWYFSKAEQMKSAQAEVDAAKTALEDAETNLADIEKRAGSAQFLDAEQRLSDARSAFQVAQRVLDETNGTSDGQSLRDAAQSALDDAKTDLENAQSDYDDALTTEGAKDVLDARAKTTVARERYYAALDALRALQVGEDAPSVATAAKAVDQAQSVLDQTQAVVDQAQAGLDLIDAQIEKLTVKAPQDGVILTRSVQPGEVLAAGMAALTIGDLSSLKVTVYIPEDRYGEVKLGGKATLSVDSFPGESFAATVTRIADQAEFTPRNVQTKEERQTTVYAVELSVDQADGKLKPGMPVDVDFGG
jgi:HlyD family secretion protein